MDLDSALHLLMKMLLRILKVLKVLQKRKMKFLRLAKHWGKILVMMGMKVTQLVAHQYIFHLNNLRSHQLLEQVDTVKYTNIIN